jgi:glycosyltransferase involved in cell wall biosynthesis
MAQTSAKESSLEVTILLPAFNEEEAIGKVIDDVKRVMAAARISHEILVVDDGSSDRTAEIAAERGAVVFRHPKTRGSGAARRTGVLHARGKIVVMLDADGTYSSEDIPRMLAMFPEHDQVNGLRTSEEGTLKLLRTPAKFLIRRLACFLARTEIPDLNTGLKAFKRDVMRRFLWVIPDGFSCVTTMTLAFLVNGYRVAWIPTGYHKRIGRSKFHPLRDTYQYILTVIRMILYFDPLRVFLPAGTLLIALGLLRWIYVKATAGEGIFLGPILVTLGFMVYVIGFLADLIVAQAKNLSQSREAQTD